MDSELSLQLKSSFSDPPSDLETLYSSFFHEPLVPVGAKTDPTQNRALVAALFEYSRVTYPDQLDVILSFMDRNPKLPWNIALLLNIGLVYRKTGHLSKAMTAWQNDVFVNQNALMRK